MGGVSSGRARGERLPSATSFGGGLAASAAAAPVAVGPGTKDYYGRWLVRLGAQLIRPTAGLEGAITGVRLSKGPWEHIFCALTNWRP